MRRSLLLAAFLATTNPLFSLKLLPDWLFHYKMATNSCADRFDSAVYVDGLVVKGAAVVEWKPGLTLSRAIAKAGGLFPNKNQKERDQFIYFAEVFRPTPQNKNPGPFRTLKPLPPEGADEFILEPEDAVSIQREKKDQPQHQNTARRLTPVKGVR